MRVRIKCAQAKRRYRKVVEYYASKEAAGSLEQLVKARSCYAFRRFRDLERKPRILLLGSDYMQDSSGMLQALDRLGDLHVYCREDGRYGLEPVALDRYATIRKNNSTGVLQLIGKMCADGSCPDIIIGQLWGCAISGEAITLIRDKYGCIALNICMDDRHTYWGIGDDTEKTLGTFGLVNDIDVALTAAPEAVEWYMKEGCPALFFPEASDPNLFRPMPELPESHDVSFVGAKYGMRRHVVDALRRAGHQVTVYGTGWKDGRIDIDEVPRLFAQSKLVLGVGTIGHCRDFHALKLRDFDAPMSGSCYITTDNGDLHELYEVGKEIVTYRSVEDCVELVSYYLENDEERRTIARNGRTRAVNDHSWEQRFRNVFQWISSIASEICVELPEAY